MTGKQRQANARKRANDNKRIDRLQAQINKIEEQGYSTTSSGLIKHKKGSLTYKRRIASLKDQISKIRKANPSVDQGKPTDESGIPASWGFGKDALRILPDLDDEAVKAGQDFVKRARGELKIGEEVKPEVRSDGATIIPANHRLNPDTGKIYPIGSYVSDKKAPASGALQAEWNEAQRKAAKTLDRIGPGGPMTAEAMQALAIVAPNAGGNRQSLRVLHYFRDDPRFKDKVKAAGFHGG